MPYSQELNRNQTLVLGALSGKPGPVTVHVLPHDLRDEGCATRT